MKPKLGLFPYETRYLVELFQPRDVCQSRHGGNAESVEAFQSIRDRLTAAQERVYRCVTDAGERGRTNDEICVVLGLMANQVSPRLTELHIARRITKIGTRLTRSKCSAGVWRATP